MRLQRSKVKYRTWWISFRGTTTLRVLSFRKTSSSEVLRTAHLPVTARARTPEMLSSKWESLWVLVSVVAASQLSITFCSGVWFGQRAFSNVSYGATVRDNQLTGGFGWAMAVNGIKDFTVQNNKLVGNTSFFGVQGVNCSMGALPLTPMAFA